MKKKKKIKIDDVRNEINCQNCKIYGLCFWHKWLLDSTKCEHKISK